MDPNCLEASPHKLTFESITSAAYKIKDGVIKSACIVSDVSYVYRCTGRMVCPAGGCLLRYRHSRFFFFFVTAEITFVRRNEYGTLFEKRFRAVHRQVITIIRLFTVVLFDNSRGAYFSVLKRRSRNGFRTTYREIPMPDDSK